MDVCLAACPRRYSVSTVPPKIADDFFRSIRQTQSEFVHVVVAVLQVFDMSFVTHVGRSVVVLFITDRGYFDAGLKQYR